MHGKWRNRHHVGRNRESVLHYRHRLIASRYRNRSRRHVEGTRVDGIYTADPEKDPTATKFHDITYDEVLKRGLKVMDLTATCMCKENNLPIVVFDMDTVGNLKKVITGEEIGTLVHN